LPDWPAAHKDALHSRAGQKAPHLCRGDEIRSAVFLPEGKAALAIQNCAVAGQVDDVRLKLAHLILQLLKAAQVAGVEGHVLAGDGPEQRLLLFF